MLMATPAIVNLIHIFTASLHSPCMAYYKRDPACSYHEYRFWHVAHAHKAF